jgi:small subunit ribosomal protein S3
MTAERNFVTENIKRVLLKEYLRLKTERAGFGGSDIQRTPLGTRVILITERPGLVIGRRGGAIKDLTTIMQKEFQFDNPQIEVQEEKEPNLNPQIMAQKLASALERGWHFRRVGHSTVRRIMDAGAKGCQVIIAGKLTGQRHRTEKFREGHIKYCGEPAKQWMKVGSATAMRKSGVLGVTVQIMDPNAKLPDEIVLPTKAIEEHVAIEEPPQELRSEEEKLREEEAAKVFESPSDSKLETTEERAKEDNKSEEGGGKE